MTVKELVEKTSLKSLIEFDDREISGVFVSDMVSDVMAGAKSGNIWLTIQTHKSIIPAANLVDVSAVIITSGKAIPKETVDLASKHGIALLSTELPTFEIIGKFYGLGLGQ
ncbi:MAG: serine kinase [Bacteroidales bacterium]|nr:serine kinase [Candidatus Latescibacterota bacterium]